MTAHPEWDLQVMVNKAVRAHVAQPHLFFSVDRSQKTSLATHIRQKARGLIPGIADTFLVIPECPIIAIELKAKGKKVEDNSTQEHFGVALILAGGRWAWADSVAEYFWRLATWDVPLVGDWGLTAANYDALLAGAAIRREEAGGTVSKRRFRAPKAPAAKIRANEKVRREVLF